MDFEEAVRITAGHGEIDPPKLGFEPFMEHDDGTPLKQWIVRTRSGGSYTVCADNILCGEDVYSLYANGPDGRIFVASILNETCEFIGLDSFTFER